MSKLDCASVNREVFLRTCRDAFFKRDIRRDRLFAERKTGKDRDSFVNPRVIRTGARARANANTENDEEEMIFDDDDDDAENLYYLSYPQEQRAKSTKKEKEKERKRGRKDTNHNHAQLVKVVISKLNYTRRSKIRYVVKVPVPSSINTSATLRLCA